MTALQRIQRAGFEVSLSGDTFTVSPASRLTPEQRDFLKAHKAEIVKELAANWPKPTSEAEHNAAGRYFKFLATWPDGRQCYLCQMPRQTVDEMREQFPDATKIEPVQNEDYTDD
jgi:hypothetical protein